MECDWDVVGVSAGARRPRTVDSPGPACIISCGESVYDAPGPVFAGADGVLVYAGGGFDGSSDNNQVKRIVGRRAFRLFTVRGDIERLVLGGGGAIEVVSRALVGNGCGCLDSPAWSPDGGKIAYARGVVSPFATPKSVAVMNADGSGRHDLTPPSKAISGPLSWSPDGNWIAYDNKGKITLVKADGSSRLPLVAGYYPSWSPDGSKIAFAILGKTPAIFDMNPDGSDVQKLTSLPHKPWGVAWSPDGTRIAVSVHGRLEVMSADGSGLHPLSNTPNVLTPAWSPDSNRIAFANDNGLAVIGADGKGLRQLTHGPLPGDGIDWEPSWSPDGRSILFASWRDDPYLNAGDISEEQVRQELYLVDPDGSHLRPLSFTRPSKWTNQTTFHSTTGKTLASLPRVPALAGKIAALGSISNGANQITLSNARTGTKLATVTLGPEQPDFSLAGADKHWIVFRRGTTIAALNVGSHQIVPLIREVAKPLDLSVSGHRVAWAENIDGHGRIVALKLPS